jgi:hypothetical protein
MAISTIQAGSKLLRTIRVKADCLGPGGTPLFKGMIVRVPENDAYTLVSGDQAEFITETAAAAAADAAPVKK